MGANIVAKAMASTSAAVAQRALAKAPIPLAKPGPVEKSAQAERVGESTSILTEIFTSQKGVTLAAASQTKGASPVTTPVISTSDPFAALSQAVKDGSTLMVTPSSISSFSTREPEAYLSSAEGSKEVLQDSEDESAMKKRVSDSDEEDSGKRKTEAIGTYLLSLLGLLFRPLLYYCRLFSLFCITFQCNL